MVTGSEVEKAINYIRDNAPLYAKAKAERVYIEQFRKSQKALLVQETSGTIQDRESYAYSHTDYILLLEGLKCAVEKEEEIKWRMEAAKLKVEIYRTEQATNRVVDRVHM